LKDKLTCNSNQLFSISTEDRARENGPKSLSVKIRLDFKTNMVVKHWNEVSKQVVGLTSLKYFKSKDKYSSKLCGKKCQSVHYCNIY
jgi:hypothetical protein